MVKLTVIIPYYKTYDETTQLLSLLDKQVTEEVEVLLIYDLGTEPYTSNYNWLTIYEQPNRGLGKARNYGIEHAKGNYIAFIDSDDLVEDCYISNILEFVDKTPVDVLQLSWRNIDGSGITQLRTDTDMLPTWNWACWARVYKKEIIGSTRFPDGWDEDVPFLREIIEKNPVYGNIKTLMYIYRNNRLQNRTHRHLSGKNEWED